MLIPVFVSCPSRLDDRQKATKNLILAELKRNRLEWRTLGETDYPTKYPLKEVLLLARHCSGGLVLGFKQLVVSEGVWHAGTDSEDRITKPVVLPTPWNQIEASILFSLNVPLLVFRDHNVRGGIFDNGVTDLFIYRLPKKAPIGKTATPLREAIRNWASQVSHHYYDLGARA